jgi:acetyl-CoA carboxylase biotin carboxyl carrier protein
MAENKKAHGHDEQSEMVRFIHKEVDPLSKAFAASPLARLRVKTKLGTVILEKASAMAAASALEPRAADASKASGEPAKTAAARYAPLVPAQNGEAGRSYITINSEVVGIFRDVSPPPVPGEALRSGQVLGYIEALRLRNEVHCPSDATLVAQVVVDSQPVDFGEALFVVDTTEAALPLSPAATVEVASSPAVAVEIVEPPRV